MHKFLTLLISSLFLVVAGYLLIDWGDDDANQMSNVDDRLSIKPVAPVKVSVQGEALYASIHPAPDSVTGSKAYLDASVWEFLEAMETDDSAYEDALLRIQPMLSHAEPETRLQAVTTLGEYRHDGVNQDLLHALEDPDPSIRIMVIEALSMQHDEFIVFYIEPALYDPDYQVRLAAIRAIAEGENEQSVYALSGLLSDRDDDIRLNAVTALGEIGGEASIHYLQQKRYDPDQRIRRNVEAILNEMDAAY